MNLFIFTQGKTTYEVSETEDDRYQEHKYGNFPKHHWENQRNGKIKKGKNKRQ